MPTIPTGQMEAELRKLYLRWLSSVGLGSDMDTRVNDFQAQSQALIERMGGHTASLGALAGFPAPKKLDLSPTVGTIYSDMKQAAIQAGIVAGLQSTDVAQAMFRNGMDKSFNRLRRLARTETTNAYWKNAFNSIADLPALVMVWGSEDGPRTCAWCRERDGLVMDSSNLRDHPNGRCTPIPTLRSQVKYKGSISADGSIYMDPRWKQEAKKVPKWVDPERWSGIPSGKVSTGSLGFKYDANPSLAESAINSKLRGVHNRGDAYPVTGRTMQAEPDLTRTFQSHVDGSKLAGTVGADTLPTRPIGFKDAEGRLVLFDGHHRTIGQWRSGVAPEVELVDISKLNWEPDAYDDDEWRAIQAIFKKNRPAP